MRQRRELGVDQRRSPQQRSGDALQFVTRIDPDRAPLEALLTRGGATDALVVCVPGFNTPLGPWEGAKAALLAEVFDCPVLLTEIPGMSRFGDALPADVRAAMLRGDPGPWADLLVDHQFAALYAAGLPMPRSVHVLGYSTGCTLGVAGLARWSEHATIASVTLVEPVATMPRNLVQLELDNLADVFRQPGMYATNHDHEWVMRLRRRQLREPWVRYGPLDLVAIAQVLATPHLPGALPLGGPAVINLVRGRESDLCPARGFDDLDAAVAAAPGVTIDVAGAGHPLWHSFPVLEALVPLLGAAALTPVPATDKAG